MLKAICSHLNSLSIFALIGVIVIVATLVLRSNLQTAEDTKQLFENHLLSKIANGNTIIVHNQGIIIHNQKQFARFGMANPAENFTTPDIRTDFWNNYTTPK